MPQQSNDIWDALKNHRDANHSHSILSLFNEPSRFENFSASCGELLFDFSKTNIRDDTLDLLEQLAVSTRVEELRDEMFTGLPVNKSEGRPALHTALRSQGNDDNSDALNRAKLFIATNQAAAESFAEGVRGGKICAADGAPFIDVLSIGIGGSDLGPLMVTRALSPYADGPRLQFISNVDAGHVADTLSDLDPRRTLVVIMSKAFNTAETMTNAETVKSWLRDGVGDQFGCHLAAVSISPERAIDFGIPKDNVFAFGNYIGGRYSLWGPVGLPIMLAVGIENFRQLLAGAAAMDDHFRTAPIRKNLPMLMGLVGVWHRSVCGYPARAVVPYDQRLEKLPDYLQQLDMESNGKGVDRDGVSLPRSSGPVVFGTPGTNGQHAFFQMLHQGTDVVPVEFLIAAQGHEPKLKHHHDLLKASCLAQSEALMRGRDFEACLQAAKDVGFEGEEAHAQAMARVCPGNRPSITLAYPKLTPFVLGQILALYEHRVFVEAAIWGSNPFDQWGVELGKELTSSLLPLMRGEDVGERDGSTMGLARKLTS